MKKSWNGNFIHENEISMQLKRNFQAENEKLAPKLSWIRIPCMELCTAAEFPMDISGAKNHPWGKIFIFMNGNIISMHEYIIFMLGNFIFS